MIPASHGKIRLACLKDSVGWLGSMGSTSRDKEQRLVPLMRRAVWLEDLICGSQVGIGTCC